MLKPDKPACGLKMMSFAPAMGRLKTVTGGRISFTVQRDSQDHP